MGTAVKTNEVDYPLPRAEGYLCAVKQSDGTFDYEWKAMSGGTQPAAPVFSIAGGTYHQAQTVTITCATDKAIIYYTTDGTQPSTSSAVYSSPVTITDTTTLTAIAVLSGYMTSAPTVATYTVIRRIYMTDNGSGMTGYYSDDNGVTWTAVTRCTDVGSNSYNTTASANGVMVTQHYSGLLVSLDRCASWTYVPFAYAPGDVWAWANVFGTSGKGPRAYRVGSYFIGIAGGTYDSSGNYYAIMTYSSDGRYWHFVSVLINSSSFYDVQAMGALADSVSYVRCQYAANVGSTYIHLGSHGLYISYDSCATWAFISYSTCGLSAISGAGVSCTIVATSSAFVIAYYGNVFYSTTGTSWTASTLAISYSSGQTPTALFVTSDKSTLYYVSNDESPYSPMISVDNGVTFKQAISWPYTYIAGLMCYDAASNASEISLISIDPQCSSGVAISEIASPMYGYAACYPIVDSEVSNRTMSLARIVWTGDKFYSVPQNTSFPTWIGTDDPRSYTVAEAAFTGKAQASLCVVADGSVTLSTQPQTSAPTIEKISTTATYLTDSGSQVTSTTYSSSMTDSCYASTTGLIYYCVNGGYIYSLNVSTGVATKLTSTARSWYGLCFCSADGYLYGCVNSGYVYKISTSGTEIAIYSTAKAWDAIAYNTTSAVLVLHVSSSYIWTMTTAGASVTSQTALGTISICQGGLKADGNGNILVSRSNGALSILSSALALTTPITSGTFGGSYPVVYFGSAYIGTDYSSMLYEVSGSTYLGMQSSSVTYSNGVVVGSSLYWFAFDSSYNRLLRTVSLGSKQVTTTYHAIHGDTALQPVILYTIDGTDPTPTTETYAPNGLVVQNATGSILTSSENAAAGYIKLTNVASGTTIKAVAVMPSQKYSSVTSLTV